MPVNEKKASMTCLLVCLSMALNIIAGISYSQQSNLQVQSQIDEIFLLPMSHCDIGFTDTLDMVAMRYKDNIDQAIEMCEGNDDFYWTIESLWQLEQWMERSTVAEVQHLKKLIDEGRIEVAAMYCNFRSGLLGIEDANRLLYPMARVQKLLDIEITTAIQNDVPGYADVYPRVLESAGISY